jgi:hypothetical protein
MLDRWWPALFFIGVGMMALAWPFYSDLYTRLTAPWRWMTMAAVGAGVVGISLLMLVMRQSAYAQPFPDHLRIITPFLRLNISYRRMLRLNTAAVSTLYPPRSLHGMKRDILEPLFRQTAVVIELTALPMSMGTLRLFLSPFFFKDRTPHIVILVRDWIGFSTVLESMRSGTITSEPALPRNSTSILSHLPHKR